MYYFAYGSNMNPRQLEALAPGGTEFLAVGRLTDHRLDFTAYSPYWGGGVADVRSSKGSVVWGIVLDITEECAEALDEYEGVSSGMYRRVNGVVGTEEGDVPVFYYVVCRKNRTIPPSRRYLDCILTGARYHGLPEDYVKELERTPCCQV
jgi:gamma-glutamylcyclotransferase